MKALLVIFIILAAPAVWWFSGFGLILEGADGKPVVWWPAPARAQARWEMTRCLLNGEEDCIQKAVKVFVDLLPSPAPEPTARQNVWSLAECSRLRAVLKEDIRLHEEAIERNRRTTVTNNTYYPVGRPRVPLTPEEVTRRVRAAEEWDALWIGRFSLLLASMEDQCQSQRPQRGAELCDRSASGSIGFLTEARDLHAQVVEVLGRTPEQYKWDRRWVDNYNFLLGLLGRVCPTR